MTEHEQGPLPCPFCGSGDVSDGEVLSEMPRGRVTTQSMCRNCGALGPEAALLPNEVDYGSVKARAEWNTRALSAPAQQWIAVETALPEPEQRVLYLCSMALVGSYNKHDGKWRFDPDEMIETEDVTHWLPLPALPSSASAKD